MICKKCQRPIVLPDDYGDYDDACEWSCNCDHTTGKIYEKHNINDEKMWEEIDLLKKSGLVS